MPDSSHRTAKGLPPPEEQSPSLPAPAGENEPDWDESPLAVNQNTPATEAISTPFGLSAPPNAAGDSQPTVISRPPNLNNSGEHTLGSIRGRRLAHFELITPIGVGGMAAVIKGRDLQLDRTVALKVLPPNMAADPENVKRFHQEARAAAKLDHENIARVFYCGEDQRLHFIAFEFVQGDNLRTILERRGQLPVGEALHYILQVTTGLAHAASRGVVHRDIKPSNIIITPQGRAKLVDMGLARTMTQHDSEALTHSGVTLGTFDYISPEQAIEPREADVRSDIYSLGCTFYHMLTGQPPVPEGTAAKKLHCHQHEFPVDPRQMNPKVPDEVAAILSRMMAKHPRDRYQKPEQLVQELLRVAQKVEAGIDRTDGLLYVDAPVPARPARPLIFVALAAVAVIALVFAVEQPGPQKTPPPRPPVRAGIEPKGPEAAPPKPADKADPPRELPRPEAGTQTFVLDKSSQKSELLAFAEKHSTGQADLDITLNADLDLSGDGNDAEAVTLTLRGKKITIHAGESQRREIALRYRGEAPVMKAALVLHADQVVLRGLRVAVAGSGSVGMTGVQIVGGQKHEVDDCWFYQRYPSYKPDQPGTSVLLDGSRGGVRPELVLKDCVFLGEEGPPTDEKAVEMKLVGKGGHYAVRSIGAGLVDARQCIFGPHFACFSLKRNGDDAGGDDDVKMLHCSALLNGGSALFDLDDDSAARANVRFCLLSRPRATEGDGAVVVRQSSKSEGGLQYTGESNRYHGLDGFWTGGPRDALPRRDHDSLVLADTPWKSGDPLLDLQRLQVAQAFQPRLGMRELRVKQGRDEVLIGVQRCSQAQRSGLTAYVSGKLPPLDSVNPLQPARKEKVVDPAIARSENGTFKTLNQALDEILPGDVVLIKHNGKLPLSPLTLEKVGMAVTIKPAKDCKPVLTLAASSKKKDTALFQLHEGRIEFQDLEFFLEPSEKDFESQAVVAVAGEATCVFKNCTIRMGEPQGCQLAAVTLSDPGAFMRRRPKPGELLNGMPTVVFDRCFICGKGDMVWCKASLPFKLEATQTAAALSGSLLAIDGSKFAESLPLLAATDQGLRCIADLQNVTAAVSGPLVSLRTEVRGEQRTLGDLKNLVPLKCKVMNCLFVPLAKDPLVKLAGLDTKASDMAIRERFDWDGTKNVYGSFNTMLVQELRSVEMMSRPLDREKWKELTGDREPRFSDQARFAEAIDNSMLPRLRPAQLAIAGLADAGANLDNLPAPMRDEVREPK